MATLRIYLKKDKVTFGEWKDGKKCAYNGLYVNDIETTSPHISSSFNPLNLGYGESILETMKCVKANDIARITVEVKNDWVADRFQTDGETFTHGDALCVVRAWVWRNGKYGPENNVSLEIVGKSLSSIICLIRKMKNETVHSQEQVIGQLRREKVDLAHKLKTTQAALKNIQIMIGVVEKDQVQEIEGLKEQLDLQTQALVDCKRDRDANGNDLNDLVVYLKLPFWKRWMTKKQSVFKKFGI